MVPFENSSFCRVQTKANYARMQFYEEVKAAVDNPAALIRVVKHAFPKVRIRMSFRQELVGKGVFQIMYGGEKTVSIRSSAIDVGEPDREFEIAGLNRKALS